MRLRPLAIGLVWVFISVGAARNMLGQSTPRGSEAPTQVLAHSDFRYYENPDTIINWPMKRTLALPDLRKLHFAASQEALPLILHGVGEKVEVYFRTFPGFTSTEEIREERYQGYNRDLLDQEFTYLVSKRLDGDGIGLDEYRTDSKGKPVSASTARGRFFRTQGFASAQIQFHPLFQPGCRFRYLGRETINKQEIEVIAFAQRPDNPKILGGFNVDPTPISLLVQGIAWIDADSSQILKMWTFLLAPRPDVGLRRVDTEIRFGPVEINDSKGILWLPREVDVHVLWEGAVYQNTHRYKNFKFSGVQVGLP